MNIKDLLIAEAIWRGLYAVKGTYFIFTYRLSYHNKDPKRPRQPQQQTTIADNAPSARAAVWLLLRLQTNPRNGKTWRNSTFNT